MIYVLVPAHNEAATVGLLLWKVRQLFTSFNREYQLVVVNDGSTDASEDVLSPYTRALPLTLINHRQRRGYAKSLEALLRECLRRTDRPKRDVAVTIQADFSESPDDLLELIKKLEGGADVVVPDRRRRTGAGRIERIARSALAALVRKRLSLGGADDVVGTMRGFRLVVVERLVREAGNGPLLTREGWAADLELLAKLARHARRIESVVVSGERPASARPSRLKPAREAWRALRASGAIARPGAPVVGEPDVSPEVERVEYAMERPTPQERAEQRHRQEHHQGRKQHQGRPQQHHRPAAESGGETSGKSRRRRRGRGRGRGRRPGQGPAPGSQQAPAPSPPPAA